MVHQIASKAPWQQGKTERHGGPLQGFAIEKSRSEVVITEEEERRQLMMEVEQAKNRYSNRSGFVPIQRQIGQWPWLPTSLLSEGAIQPCLVEGMLTDDIEKVHEMHRVAQKAFCEYNTRHSVQKAFNGRPRT